MRTMVLTFLMVAGSFAAMAQVSGTPANAKARKTYAEAIKLDKQHQYSFALEAFRKADKQDGGHCTECARQVVSLALKLGDFKAADAASQEMLSSATTLDAAAAAHYLRGIVFLNRGERKKNHSEFFQDSDGEFKAALTADPHLANAYYADGTALAFLQQDEAAKAQFERFVQSAKQDNLDVARAQRFVRRPELARERMAPAFAVTTLDGKRVSLDGLAGKVVLIDFWASWCGPCKEALPHMKKIVQQFAGQPLVVLSVSLDSDDGKWRSFVAKNQMNWMQYRDGGFQGPLSTAFGVRAIPATFTIDADGVLQDEHIGDGSIEGKLRKLIAQARQEQGPSAQRAAGQ